MPLKYFLTSTFLKPYLSLFSHPPWHRPAFQTVPKFHHIGQEQNIHVTSTSHKSASLPTHTLPCLSFVYIPQCITRCSNHNLNRRWMFSFLHKESYKNNDKKGYLKLQTHYIQIPLLLKCEYTLETGCLTADHQISFYIVFLFYSHDTTQKLSSYLCQTSRTGIQCFGLPNLIFTS